MNPTHETTLTWRNPENGERPPFNTPILVCLGSWRDEGGGFHAHAHFQTVRVMQEDTDGDEDEGESIAADLNSGEITWGDAQFMLHDDDGEELDTYSDSIVWWTEAPSLPDERK